MRGTSTSLSSISKEFTETSPPRTALILGLLYLAFQSFPIIFGRHGFSEGFIGLSFLGIGFGMVIAASLQPFWNRY